jgi:hypothetical protein
MNRLFRIHVAGMAAALTAFVFSTLCLARAALAQETPILVASDVPQINGWCGDHAVYFNANVGAPARTI